MREMAEIQDRVVIIGNSIASYLRVGEVPRVARSGRTLTDMMHDITSFRCTKLVISGIPDLFDRGSCIVTAARIEFFKRDLQLAASEPGVILCPMYPVKSLPARQWGIVQRINNYICDLNAGNGEGTPKINRCLFGRANGGRLFFNFERLVDEAHPSQELAAEMSAILEDFLVGRDARRRPDLRQRLENIREEREEDVDPEGGDRDGSVDGEEGHQEEGDALLQIDISSDEQELLEDRQEDYEEERERIARENERERRNARQSRNDREDSIRARYEQELRENTERYERELEEIERRREEAEARLRERIGRQQERLREEERREDRRRRDRQEREEEPRDREMRNRDIRMDVPRRRDLV